MRRGLSRSPLLGFLPLCGVGLSVVLIIRTECGLLNPVDDLPSRCCFGVFECHLSESLPEFRESFPKVSRPYISGRRIPSRLRLGPLMISILISFMVGGINMAE